MEKIKQMFSSIRRFAPRKTAAVLLVASAVVIPAAMFAFGPERSTFTIEKPADYVTFNSITNNPNVGDERNFVGIREDNGDKGIENTWYDNMKVQPGKQYVVRMYVHNNAASNLKLVAQNVRAHFILPTETAKNIRVDGYITSDNAKPNKIWDEANFTSDKEFNLAYVAGSAKYENNKGTFALPESIFTANGALLGYEKMNGQIPGCFQYAGYVTFKVKPQFAKNFELNKTVRKNGEKDWKESVEVKVGEKVDYQIMMKNISGVQMNNVMLLDTLPKGVKYVAGSTMVANATNPKGVKVGDNLTTKGINIGNYANSANAYVKFSAIVTGENLVCGKNTLRNVAKVESDFGAKTDTADVVVQKECLPPPVKKNPSYDLIKTVDKVTAKPGETINYTLTFKNTGNQNLTNVIIKDQLPEGISWTNVKVSVKNGEGISGQKELFGKGLKIAKINVGGSATVKISAKINSDAVKAEKCGENVREFVNKAEVKTDQKKDQTNNADEDNAKNNSAKTVVTAKKDCKYSYDLAKTADKKTAKPGETINYTLTFKNTGNQDLTNVVIKDQMPKNLAKISVKSDTEFSGDLFGEGLKIAKVKAGEQVVINLSAKIANAAKFDCGETELVNKAEVKTDQKKDQTNNADEDNAKNNSAKTVVSKECEPVTPPPTPPTTTTEVPKNPTPTTQDVPVNPSKPKVKNDNPTVLASTGAGDAIMMILATGALTFGSVAYLRSRRALNSLNR